MRYDGAFEKSRIAVVHFEGDGVMTDVETEIHNDDHPSVAKGQLWSPEEDQILHQLKVRGQSFRRISVVTGRTISSVKARWEWLHLTEEQRQHRRARINLSRHIRQKSSPRHLTMYASTAQRPPEALLAERDQRLYAPRSLTATFFGDPAPGFSALDRRQTVTSQ